MYTEIGEVSDATVSELKNILLEATRWEHHVSEVTDHKAFVCKDQLQEVNEIVGLWPVETWASSIFLRLTPGGKLYRHADEGFGFHIPVETNEDCVSLSYEDGKKEHHLEVGKVYHVNRSIEHESFNNGDTDRTHLIVIQK